MEDIKTCYHSIVYAVTKKKQEIETTNKNSIKTWEEKLSKP